MDPRTLPPAPFGDDFHEIELAALTPDPEHIRMIQKEAVKSAMLSVADLRQGRSAAMTPHPQRVD